MQVKEQYRPNVAVVITDGAGSVLLCRRRDEIHPGTWQCVQGGIENDETVLEAAYKEIFEEIGVPRDRVNILDVMPEKFAYRWDDDYIAKYSKNGPVGQEQTFVFARIDHDEPISLTVANQEFAEVTWGSPEELLQKSWGPKKPGTRAALIHFGLITERE